MEVGRAVDQDEVEAVADLPDKRGRARCWSRSGRPGRGRCSGSGGRARGRSRPRRTAVGRISSSGAGTRPSPNRAAIDRRAGRARIASGPMNAWVKLACGSTSRRSTRRPSLASVPARWNVVEVLPTPPLRFRGRRWRRASGPLPGEDRRPLHRARVTYQGSAGTRAWGPPFQLGLHRANHLRSRPSAVRCDRSQIAKSGSSQEFTPSHQPEKCAPDPPFSGPAGREAGIAFGNRTWGASWRICQRPQSSCSCEPTAGTTGPTSGRTRGGGRRGE